MGQQLPEGPQILETHGMGSAPQDAAQTLARGSERRFEPAIERGF